MQSPLRTAMAGLIGNVLEWFDYAVYGYFSTEIAAQFFPASMDDYTKQLLAYVVFWIGFAARPIGVRDAATITASGMFPSGSGRAGVNLPQARGCQPCPTSTAARSPT